MNFISNLKTKAVLLKLAVNSQKPELLELYKSHVKSHNESIEKDEFPNSGFDLFVPEKTTVSGLKASMVSMDVKCEMVDENGPSPYFLFPRSSFSKTPLMLANHTGIIDSGYRGFLIGALRNLDSQNPYIIEPQTRLLQICHPALRPIHVILVEESELSTTTRGSGGFGSTGI